MKDVKSINSAPKGCGKIIRFNKDDETVCTDETEYCPDCKKLNEQRSKE